jgi:hypothetical protein
VQFTFKFVSDQYAFTKIGLFSSQLIHHLAIFFTFILARDLLSPFIAILEVNARILKAASKNQGSEKL